MIVLTLFPSKKEHIYKTKTNALRDIKGNALKSYEYELVDTDNNTTYMQGLWLTKKELNIVSNSKTISRGIKLVKYYRKKK